MITDINSRDLKDLVRQAGRITDALRRIADALETANKRGAVTKVNEADKDEKEE